MQAQSAPMHGDPVTRARTLYSTTHNHQPWPSSANRFHPDGILSRDKIFDVAQAQGEPEVEPDRLLNDLGWEPVAAVADSLHPVGYRATKGTATSRAT